MKLDAPRAAVVGLAVAARIEQSKMRKLTRKYPAFAALIRATLMVSALAFERDDSTSASRSNFESLMMSKTRRLDSVYSVEMRNIAI
jgi:hypothetical protein